MEAFSNSKDYQKAIQKGSVRFLLARLTRLLQKQSPDRLEALGRYMPADIEDTLRKALAKDGRTHYAIGKASGIAPAVLDRFSTGERSLTLPTAAKLAAELGYQLVKPKKPKR
jgi:hypothetical protein